MSQMGVYRSFRLARSGNSFSAEMGKKLERDLHVITNEYADNINAHSDKNGLYYEKDENATALYLEGKPFKAISVKEIQVKEAEEVNPELEAAREQYKSLAEKEAPKNWGLKKLTEEIEKLELN